MADLSDELRSAPAVHYALLDDAARINPALRAAYRRAALSNQATRTHHFHGRFENSYVDREALPELDPVIDFVVGAARHHLGQQHIRFGFWFNEMQPGQRTSRHSHQELDELLSAVYYVTAPAGCGRLILHDPPVQISIVPQSGLLVMFPPETEHEVEENTSSGLRLSIAFNFGPQDAPR